MKHLLALPYEIWRDIKGYEGLYQVSNFGRVRSLDHYANHIGDVPQLRKGKICKPYNQNGYLRIHLSKKGKLKNYLVHRLVAEAFIPNPHNYPTVDHINRIKTDNREENLRWAPYKLQTKNSDRKTQIQGAKRSCSKPVLQYTLDMVLIKEYPSVMEAERQTGISNRHISECCRGKRKTAGGYIWKYKN